MNNAELLDQLNRAYIMEEQMSDLLLDLCQPTALPNDLSKESHKRIAGILSSIEKDTLRHKEIILAIQKEIK